MRALPSASTTAIRTFSSIASNAYRRLNALDKALADYETAMKLRPKSPAPYIGRGNVRGMQGDDDAAIADFDAAIKLNPKDLEAYLNRGTAQAQKGDLAGAVATFDTILRQWPDDVPVYANRGFTRFAAGDFAGAAADLEHASQGTPANLYVPLWRYLSRARLGEKDTAELERSLKSVDRTAWPAPVLDLFLGQAKPDAVRAAAAEGDAAGRADRDCEASFYLGEFALLDGRREDALGLLRQAGDQCPAGFTERAAARGEAARLAK
jgi:lipoprotein NlpI